MTMRLFSVALWRQGGGPCDGLIPRPNGPMNCLLRLKKKTEVSQMPYALEGATGIH
jgi:hypothetical protein